MRLRRVIAWFGLALLLLVAGAALWLWHADLGRFEDSIETSVSEAIGRELLFETLSLDLGRTIRVDASGVTLANPDWAPNPLLLQVDRLEGEIEMASLFRDGPIVIHRLRAQGVTLSAFRDAEGRHSFQFDTGEPPAPEPPSRDEPLVLPLLIRDGRVEDAILSYEDDDRAHPLLAQLRSLAVKETDDRRLDLTIDGDMNERSVRFDGEMGPTEALFDGGPLEFDASGAFGSLTLVGTGIIDDLHAPDRPEVSIQFAGPDIRDLERLLGLEPAGPGAFDIRFAAEPGDDRWLVSLDGEVGDFDMDFTGESEGLQSLDGVVIDLHLRGPSLQAPLRPFGIDNVPDERFELVGVMRRQGKSMSFENVSSVIGETTFDLNGHLQDFTNFRDSRLRLDIAGPDVARFRDLIGIPGLAEGPFSLHLELNPTPQGIGLVQGQLQSSLGDVQLSGTIGDQPGYAGTEATVAISGVNAKTVLDALGVPGFRAEPFTLEGEIAVEDNAVRLRTLTLDGVLAARLEANGRIAYDFFTPDTSLDLRLTGADIGQTMRYSDQEVPAWRGSFDVQTRMRATPAGLRFDAVQARVGEATLVGDALIPLNEDLDGLDVTFQAGGPNLGALLADSVDFEVPDVDWALSTHLRRTGQQLLVEDVDLRVAKTTVTGKIDLPWPANVGNGTFQLDAAGPDLSRVIPRIDAFRPTPVPFELGVDGNVRNDVWTFDRFTLDLDNAKLAVSGTFDDLPDFSDTRLSVNASFPDLSRLGSWEEESLPELPLNLSFNLTGAPNDLFIDDLRATLGESELEGRVGYTTVGAVPLLELSLASESVDLRPLLDPPEPAPATLPPPSGSDPGSDRVIPDTDLPLEFLARRDMNIDLRFDEFLTHERIVSDVDIQARVSDGALYLERYRTRGMVGKVSASASLVPREGGPADLTLAIDATNLAPIRETWQNADPATLPQINAQARLSAKGNDVRALAATLSGDAIFYATEGTLPGEGLSALNLGITDIVLGAIAPDEETKRPTNLICFAGRVRADQGVLATEPIGAMRSDRVLLLASGSIDLKSERLDLGFEVIPTKLLGVNLAELANSLLRIRGTLARPTAEIDPAGTLVYGGAAVATGGLSILAKGLVDRLRKSSAPCDRLREEVIAEGQARQQNSDA